MSIKIHPRTRLTNEARAKIEESVGCAVQDFHLTYAELLFILADITKGWASFQIRDEREENKEPE